MVLGLEVEKMSEEPTSQYFVIRPNHSSIDLNKIAWHFLDILFRKLQLNPSHGGRSEIDDVFWVPAMVKQRAPDTRQQI